MGRKRLPSIDNEEKFIGLMDSTESKVVGVVADSLETLIQKGEIYASFHYKITRGH